MVVVHLFDTFGQIYLVGLLIMVRTMIIEKIRVNENEMSDIGWVVVWVPENEIWVHKVHHDPA